MPGGLGGVQNDHPRCVEEFTSLLGLATPFAKLSNTRITKDARREAQTISVKIVPSQSSLARRERLPKIASIILKSRFTSD
jgi:hypothetical protein